MAKLSAPALNLLRLALLLAMLAVASANGYYGKHRRHWRPRHKKHHNYYCQWKGSVCHDPVLVGADGQQFYFHGHKDADFCLLSDSNLHINAHFIGRRREDMPRDFTWVQALGIHFGSHQLYIGANKVASWDDNVEQMTLALDDVPVLIPQAEDAMWEAPSAGLTIARLTEHNSIAVQVEGQFKLLAKVVPVTQAENLKHNYGITPHDCFAHLEVNFQFYSLSADVSGVLGQTYTAQYKALEKEPGQLMPTMGGDAKFQTSGIMATDCAVSRFGTFSATQILHNLNPISCASESTAPGLGMVCRR